MLLFKRSLLGLVVFMFSTAVLMAGGGAEAPEDGSVSIEYWNINSADFGEQAVLNSIEEFQADNPSIRVLHRYQAGSYGGLLENLQAAIAAGSPPAIAQIGYNNRLFAMNELPHVPIEEFSDVEGYDDFIDGFIDGMLGLVQDSDGVQRGVPYALSVPMLYYNADIFEEAGLDPDSPPQTWQELREAALQIREETGEYGIGLQISTANNWLPQTLVESNGGFFLDPDTGEVGVDSSETLEVYRFWQELALEDQSLPVVSDAEQEQAFNGGRLGMYVKTSAALAGIQEQADFDLRTAEVPSWGDRPRRLASGGNALFIFANEEDQQAAAFEFIKFLLSKRGQTIWVMDTGYVPLVRDVEDDPDYLQGFFAENPLTSPALNQLPDSVPWMPFPGARGQEAEEVLIEAREAILDGSPVEETLRDAADRIRGIL